MTFDPRTTQVGNALEVARFLVVELLELMPTNVRLKNVDSAITAIAQTIITRLFAWGVRVNAYFHSVFEPRVIRADNVIHVPQLRASVLHHRDAVAH